MIYDPDTDPHLKSWLVKNLEPICDAEPGALADYILALLKHPASEPDLRNELVSQLEEFLEKGSETTNFIDLLFNAIRSKSYLPYTSSPPPLSLHPPRIQPRGEPPSLSDAGIPIPLDVLVPQQQSSSRKRSLEHPNDEREYRKGPRLSNDTQFSRYGNTGRQWSGSNRGRGRDSGSYGADAGAMQSVNGVNSMGQYMNGRPQQQYRPPDQVKKGICRDYHNHGYCSRGAYCKYSHGEDAVVPSQLLPMASMSNGMVPFMSMINSAMFPGGGMATNGAMGGAGGGAYDPHERMDMRPRGGMTRTPMVHRQDGPIPSSGELPVIQDLTPRIPVDEQRRTQPQHNYVPLEKNSDIVQAYSNITAMDIDVDGMQQQREQQHSQYTQPPNNHHQLNGGYRGGGRRGGRAPHVSGTFPIDDLPQPDHPSTSSNHSPFPTSVPRPERRNDKTLVVEKIPDDHLSLGAVNDWFKRFGTVTNVAVDAKSAKALVSFAEHEDAHKAWKSEDAVFGNRFVKVFWHRPMGGHGGMGARMLQASAPLVNKLAINDGAGPDGSDAVVPKPTAPAVDPGSSASATSSIPVKKPASSATVSALAAKQELLKQQIVEQKSLMAKLESAGSPEEKKEILGQVRKLREEMKSSTSTGSPISTISTPAIKGTSTPGTGRSEHQERLERERLDKELELHAATTAVDSEIEESTEDLKAKLAKLKAEAASLGLPEADPSYPAYNNGSHYRPYRGRGRGAGRGGYYRGRGGGPPRTSMKLDNRPKKLLLKGVDPQGIQTVKDWYATTGSLESVETLEDGDLVVLFKTRGAAEQGLAKGSNVPTIGQVQVSWYADQPSVSRQQSQSSVPSHTSKQDVSGAGGKANHTLASANDTQRMQEEELVASGWGDDGEDGMGML